MLDQYPSLYTHFLEWHVFFSFFFLFIVVYLSLLVVQVSDTVVPFFDIPQGPFDSLSIFGIVGWWGGGKEVAEWLAFLHGIWDIRKGCRFES